MAYTMWRLCEIGPGSPVLVTSSLRPDLGGDKLVSSSINFPDSSIKVIKEQMHKLKTMEADFTDEASSENQRL